VREREREPEVPRRVQQIGIVMPAYTVCPVARAVGSRDGRFRIRRTLRDRPARDRQHGLGRWQARVPRAADCDLSRTRAYSRARTCSYGRSCFSARACFCGRSRSWVPSRACALVYPGGGSRSCARSPPGIHS
jgi:hypothetical protein